MYNNIILNHNTIIFNHNKIIFNHNKIIYLLHNTCKVKSNNRKLKTNKSITYFSNKAKILERNLEIGETLATYIFFTSR